MGVVPFRTARQRAGSDDLRSTAEAIVAELGERAGWVIGVAARATQEPERRKRLFALVDEIERVAGFGSVFGEED
jgi:hypothetical protein